eukprot:TRINITY_DN5188_c0_g1_i1.p1 TRINITY_DN5188_c0_g1~~TRINITY_DN5188_c0_g1_i1.p1  ORF type:complete len:109 (-),score=22.60 TRINITY_DN5188_c0_g1_i1:192-518(-)
MKIVYNIILITVLILINFCLTQTINDSKEEKENENNDFLEFNKLFFYFDFKKLKTLIGNRVSFLNCSIFLNATNCEEFFNFKEKSCSTIEMNEFLNFQKQSILECENK